MLRQLIRRKASVVGSLAAAALAIPLAASSTPAGLASATATPPKCVTSQLVVWMGVPGNRYFGPPSNNLEFVNYQMEFTNVGSTTCTFYGFPGVSVWANGQMIGIPATWGHTVPTQTLTVLPGATVHTTLRVVVPYWDPICKPVTATSLKIYPPNNAVARNISFQVVMQMQHLGGGRSCGWGESLSVRGPIVPRVGIPGH